MCIQPNISVYEAKLSPRRITFTRWLVDKWKEDWDEILENLVSTHLNEEPDVAVWRLEKSGKFSVKSVYNALSASEAGSYHKLIWKGRVPARIKIFLWLVINDAILTRDNLMKRRWKGEPTCCFCDLNESVSHLLFECSVAKSI